MGEHLYRHLTFLDPVDRQASVEVGVLRSWIQWIGEHQYRHLTFLDVWMGVHLYRHLTFLDPVYGQASVEASQDHAFLASVYDISLS